jgi:hypothetical protein
MIIEISQNGRIHKGRTAKVSQVDEDLATLRWSCRRINRTNLYVAHNTTIETAGLFGVEVGTTVYMHRVVLARKLKIAYALLGDTVWQTEHVSGNTLDNSRRNIRKRNGRK